MNEPVEMLLLRWFNGAERYATLPNPGLHILQCYFDNDMRLTCNYLLHEMRQDRHVGWRYVGNKVGISVLVGRLSPTTRDVLLVTEESLLKSCQELDLIMATRIP